MHKLCTVSKKIEDVLLVLDEKELTRKEILAFADIGWGTMTKIIDWMIKMKLAEEVPISRYKAVIRLTDKGKRLVELVKEIHSLLGDP